MEVYKILMIIISFLIVFSAAKKIKAGMSFEEYSIERGFGIYLLTVIKFIFIVITLIDCINWTLLNYKITFKIKYYEIRRKIFCR